MVKAPVAICVSCDKLYGGVSNDRRVGSVLAPYFSVSRFCPRRTHAIAMLRSFLAVGFLCLRIGDQSRCARVSISRPRHQPATDGRSWVEVIAVASTDQLAAG